MTDRRQEMIEAMQSLPVGKNIMGNDLYLDEADAEKAFDGQLNHLATHPDPNERALGEMLKHGCEEVRCYRCKGEGAVLRLEENGSGAQLSCHDCNGSGTLYRIGKES